MVAKNAGDAVGVSAGGGREVARSVEIASGGIGDTRDLCRFGTALLGDIMTGSVNPKIANPVCRTGNLILRSAEMEQKYGAGHALPLS